MNRSPEEDGGNPSGEPVEDSTESVLDYLDRYEQELAASGKISPEDSEDLLLRGPSIPYIEPEDLAQEVRERMAEEDFAAYVKTLRAHLTTVGLADPGSVTPERLKDEDDEFLRQMDPINAECLFFDVARRVHRRLSPYEPIAWKRLSEQAHLYPEKNGQEGISPIEVVKDKATGQTAPLELAAVNFNHSQYLDLDQLQLEQRLDNYGWLVRLGLNPDEIQRLQNGGPEMAQNINRLAYFFQEEPTLAGYRNALREKRKKPEWKTKEHENPWSIHRAVKVAQFLLKRRLEKLENQKELQSHYQLRKDRWDSIDYDVYKRVSRRIRTSLAISNRVLHDMRLESVDSFLESYGENGNGLQ